MKCLACTQVIRREELLVCIRCKGTYHYKCLNITTAQFMNKNHDIKRTWCCPSCVNVTSRRIKDDTPVRKQFESTLNQTDMSCEDIIQDQRDLNESLSTEQPNTIITSSMLQCQSDKCINISLEQLSSLLDTKLNHMRSSITKEIKQEFDIAVAKLKKEFTETTDFLSAQLVEVKSDISSFSNKISLLESENKKLQAELCLLKNQTLPSTYQDLRNTITQLQVNLNERDQQALLNDLEISGIPENSNESVPHIVVAVAAKLGTQLEESDIVSASRVGNSQRFSDLNTQALGRPPRHRHIVVRLCRRVIRDELLRNARVRRGATTADLGLPSHEPRPFYLNERLTSTNRQLFGKARDIGRGLNWKYIWTKEGRIFARQSDSSKIHQLRSIADIERIFGVLSENSSK
ncbi:unnamed protein product [Parnassius mnemosyne]|uniref:PHD-type domain-containing protein n=1 Tax=Parnassius mnemosyne TaxID=213953 RepID=A0AAV1M0Q2_9NEOP